MLSARKTSIVHDELLTMNFDRLSRLLSQCAMDLYFQEGASTTGVDNWLVEELDILEELRPGFIDYHLSRDRFGLRD